MSIVYSRAQKTTHVPIDAGMQVVPRLCEHHHLDRREAGQGQRRPGDRQARAATGTTHCARQMCMYVHSTHVWSTENVRSTEYLLGVGRILHGMVIAVCLPTDDAATSAGGLGPLTAASFLLRRM